MIGSEFLNLCAWLYPVSSNLLQCRYWRSVTPTSLLQYQHLICCNLLLNKFQFFVFTSTADDVCTRVVWQFFFFLSQSPLLAYFVLIHCHSRQPFPLLLPSFCLFNYLSQRVNMEFMTHELDTVHDHALEVRTHATLCLTFNLMTHALVQLSSQSYIIYYSHPCPYLSLPFSNSLSLNCLPLPLLIINFVITFVLSRLIITTMHAASLWTPPRMHLQCITCHLLWEQFKPSCTASITCTIQKVKPLKVQWRGRGR